MARYIARFVRHAKTHPWQTNGGNPPKKTGVETILFWFTLGGFYAKLRPAAFFKKKSLRVWTAEKPNHFQQLWAKRDDQRLWDRGNYAPFSGKYAYERLRSVFYCTENTSALQLSFNTHIDKPQKRVLKGRRHFGCSLDVCLCLVWFVFIFKYFVN